MNEQRDHSIRELAGTRLALRSDLVFAPRTSGGETYYMVEDPVTSRFFRLGLEEYAFVSLLDGRTSIGDALEAISEAMPDHRLTEHDAAAICKWLVESDLAHTNESAHHGNLADTAETADRQRALGTWNPLVMRVPFGNPERFFNAVAPWLGWLFSPLATLGALIFASIATYQVFANWERFTDASAGIFAPANWLWLLACWVVLKIIHETAHGVVCKTYGGSVRETGVLLILLAPLAYVDVTSSWRFRSKWQRIHTAAAGMYIEILIASVAALIWSATGDSQLNHLCYNIVIMASLTTILFNANALMKFDGYYILSDLLGIPNLYVQGHQYLIYWARKYLLGVSATLPNWPRTTGVIVRVYGFAALVWRIVICVSLTVAAATLLHGAGIVLAALAIILWIGLPAFRFTKYLLFGKPGEQPNRIRFLLTAGTGTVVVVAIFALVPWPGATQAPVIVEYSPHTVVRAASSGFVEEIHVEGGQQVSEGQLLIVLENDELERELADLRLEIQQKEIEARIYEQKGELAAQQAELKKRDALLARLAEKQAEVDSLEIRAPHNGKVIGRRLDNLAGDYVDEGEEIISIGDDQQKELRVSVSQDDVDVFSEQVGEPMQVRLDDGTSISGRLAKVIPRASLEPTHPALSAANGGPLPVKNRTVKSDATGEHESYDLLAPRFTAIIPLSPLHATRLRSGQMGTLSYRAFDESIGAHLYYQLSRWIRERIRDSEERQSG